MLGGAVSGFVVAALAIVVLTYVCSIPVLGFFACFGLPAPPAWEAIIMLGVGVVLGANAAA